MNRRLRRASKRTSAFDGPGGGSEKRQQAEIRGAMISLSDDELQIIMAAAAPIHPRDP